MANRKIDSLHDLEGSLWEFEGDVHMFCQIGKDEFKFINIEEGNREFDHYHPKCHKDLKEFYNFVKENDIHKLNLDIKNVLTKAIKVLFAGQNV